MLCRAAATMSSTKLVHVVARRGASMASLTRIPCRPRRRVELSPGQPDRCGIVQRTVLARGVHLGGPGSRIDDASRRTRADANRMKRDTSVSETPTVSGAKPTHSSICTRGRPPASGADRCARIGTTACPPPAGRRQWQRRRRRASRGETSFADGRQTASAKIATAARRRLTRTERLMGAARRTPRADRSSSRRREDRAGPRERRRVPRFGAAASIAHARRVDDQLTRKWRDLRVGRVLPGAALDPRPAPLGDAAFAELGVGAASPIDARSPSAGISRSNGRSPVVRSFVPRRRNPSALREAPDRHSRSEARSPRRYGIRLSAARRRVHRPRGAEKCFGGPSSLTSASSRSPEIHTVADRMTWPS